MIATKPHQRAQPEAQRDHAHTPSPTARGWVVGLLVAEALVVLACLGAYLLGHDLWGFAAVGITCAALSHLPFVTRRQAFISMWGLASLSVTIGAGVRGVLIAIHYPSSEEVDALFLGGRTFGSLALSSVIAMALLAAVVGGYIASIHARPKVRRAHRRGWALRSTDMNETSAVAVALGYALVGLIATVAYSHAVGGLDAPIGQRRAVRASGLDGATFQSYGQYKLLAGAGAIGAIFLLLYWLQKRPRLGAIRFVVMVGLFINAIAIDLITTTRADVVILAFAVVAVIVLVRGRIQFGWLAVLGVLCVLLLGTLTAARLPGGGRGPSVSFGLQSLLLNQNGYDLSKTLRVIDAVPMELPYQYGKTIATLVIAPIPRSLWPNKPAVNPGPVIGHVIYGQPLSGVPPGGTAELVWNFGIAMALVFAVLAGFILGRCERRWYPRDRRSVTEVIFYVLVAITIGQTLLGTSIGQAVYGAAFTWTMLLPLYLLGRRSRLREQRIELLHSLPAPRAGTRPVCSGPAARQISLGRSTLTSALTGPSRSAGVGAGWSMPLDGGRAASFPAVVARDTLGLPDGAGVADTGWPPVVPSGDGLDGRGAAARKRELPSRPNGWVRGAVRRAAGATVDEALSSLQNFIVLFWALHSLDVDHIGAFTLAYTSILLVLVVVRSLVLEPMSIRYAFGDAQRLRLATGAAAGASATIGLVGMVACSLAAWAVRGDAGSILLASGVIVPILLIQDAWRSHLFAAGRPWAAALNEAACFALTLGAAITIGSVGPVTVPRLLAVWGFGTGGGLVIGMWQTRASPHLRAAPEWLRSQRDLGLRLAGETAAQQAAGRLSLFALSAIAGVAALGKLSAARTLVAPLTTLLTAALGFAVPEAVALKRRGGNALDRYVAAVSLVLTAIVLAFGVAIFFAPEGIGRLLAGRNWRTAKELLIPTALWAAGMAAAQGLRVGLRALGEADAVLRSAVVVGLMLVVGTSTGAAVAGAAGAAWAFGGVSLASVLPYGVSYMSARRATGSKTSRSQRAPI